MAKHYLVLWGDAADQIRIGSGQNEHDAKRDAFGLDAPNMATIQLTMKEIRSNKQKQAKINKLVQLQLLRYQFGDLSHDSEANQRASSLSVFISNRKIAEILSFPK